MSQTSPAYTYLHAGTGLCTSLNKDSFNKCPEVYLLCVLPNDT